MDADRASRWDEDHRPAELDRARDEPLGALMRVLGGLTDIELAGRYGFADRVLPVGGAVLDAGCGEGTGTRLLRRTGRTVLSIDRTVSPFAPPDVRINRGDLAGLHADDGAFAGIACLDALDETEAPDRILAEFRRTLSPAGVLVVSLREARRAGSAVSFERLEATIRETHADVRRVEGSPLLGWRAGPATERTQLEWAGAAAAEPAPDRFFLVASSAPLGDLPGVFLEAPPLDGTALGGAIHATIELVRRLRLDLEDARIERERLAELRARLVDAEQKIAVLPDVRRAMRTLLAERDGFHRLLRRALDLRPYPQLATVLVALAAVDVQVDSATREALHALLSELDGREDLQRAFARAGQVRLHELLAWSLHAPPADSAAGRLHRHLPTLRALLDRLPTDRDVFAPVSAS